MDTGEVAHEFVLAQELLLPIKSMHGVYIYIYLHEDHKNQPNVGKYIICAFYGLLIGL